MNAFAPKNPDHAISAAAFTITFNAPLSAECIERTRAIEASVKAFLPGIATFPRLPPAILAALRTAPAGMPAGIVFQRVQPDGTPSWILTAQQNFIAAHCMEYSRWVEVWGKIRVWLKGLYDHVKSPELAVVSISLQYVDQFLADEPLDDDAISKCFRIGTEYLPARAFSNKDLWHVNQGWFELTADPLPGKQLQVINISTQNISNQIGLNIDHLMRHDVEDANPPLFALSPDGKTLIDRLMDTLHETNKSFLRSLLTPEMANLIHLDD
jgi:uncharacterized protein (TIGR04255 family)